jgi:hypothetical protein
MYNPLSAALTAPRQPCTTCVGPEQASTPVLVMRHRRIKHRMICTAHKTSNTRQYIKRIPDRSRTCCVAPGR